MNKEKTEYLVDYGYELGFGLFTSYQSAKKAAGQCPVLKLTHHADGKYSVELLEKANSLKTKP